MAPGDWALRRVLLVLVGLGAAGLVLELLLLEHFDEWTQWLPLLVLGVVIATATALWLRPRRAILRAFAVTMALTMLTGVAGLWLHFAGNRAFELELDGTQTGWLLLWHSLRGATPALAPGAMIQLGLLGLLVTWRHPAWGDADIDSTWR